MVLIALLALSGCREEAPARKPTPARAFTPPADGVVRVEQVEDWLRVRERMRGRGEAEGAAARALGVNPREAAWVGERVGEARRLAAGRGLDERIASGRSRFRAALLAERPRAAPERQAEIDRLLAEFPPGGGREAGTPAAKNAEVIAPFARRIEALAAVAPDQKKHQVERRVGQ